MNGVNKSSYNFANRRLFEIQEYIMNHSSMFQVAVNSIETDEPLVARSSEIKINQSNEAKDVINNLFYYTTLADNIKHIGGDVKGTLLDIQAIHDSLRENPDNFYTPKELIYIYYDNDESKIPFIPDSYEIHNDQIYTKKDKYIFINGEQRHEVSLSSLIKKIVEVQDMIGRMAYIDLYVSNIENRKKEITNVINTLQSNKLIISGTIVDSNDIEITQMNTELTNLESMFDDVDKRVDKIIDNYELEQKINSGEVKPPDTAQAAPEGSQEVNKIDPSSNDTAPVYDKTKVDDKTSKKIVRMILIVFIIFIAIFFTSIMLIYVYHSSSKESNDNDENNA